MQTPPDANPLDADPPECRPLQDVDPPPDADPHPPDADIPDANPSDADAPGCRSPGLWAVKRINDNAGEKRILL